MPAFTLNKLIRDKVLLKMEALGQVVTCRQLSDEQYARALADKLREEVTEFDPAHPDTDELADILEVVEASAKLLDIDFEKLRSLQLARREQQGGFEQRIYVEKLELQTGDSWIEYYQKDPVKYPPA